MAQKLKRHKAGKLPRQGYPPPLHSNQPKICNPMKKAILFITFTMLLSISALAQNRARVFDNFDTSGGVKVASPTIQPVVYKKTSAKKSKKRKSSKKMNASEGMALKNSFKASYKPILMMGSSRSMKSFTTGDPRIDSYIVGASKKYGIDPLLIYSQMHQESAFKKRARSHKGASGLMQLMPATARRFGVTKIYDPKQNIYAGVRYMRWLLNKFNGNVVLALAGYNAGEGAVMKYGNNVPPYRETREYVRRITGRYNKISNPSYRRASMKVNRKQAAKINTRKAKPLTVLELDVVTVKLPNGRMRLVSN